MRALIASPLGFLIGLSLGALGGGGSILAVPALVYVAGQSARDATTTSLMVVGMASLVGMDTHRRLSLARALINDPDLLLLGFSGLVVIAAWRMLTACPTCTRAGEERALAELEATPSRRTVAGLDAAALGKVLVAGTVVGFLTGLFGVGGGFVIIPALTLALGMAMPEAVRTSLLIIAINCAVALGTRFATVSVDWAVALPFTGAAIAGVVTGGRVANRLDAKKSLRWFAALLLGVAVYTAIRAGLALR